MWNTLTELIETARKEWDDLNIFLKSHIHEKILWIFRMFLLIRLMMIFLPIPTWITQLILLGVIAFPPPNGEEERNAIADAWWKSFQDLWKKHQDQSKAWWTHYRSKISSSSTPAFLLHPKLQKLGDLAGEAEKKHPKTTRNLLITFATFIASVLAHISLWMSGFLPEETQKTMPFAQSFIPSWDHLFIAAFMHLGYRATRIMYATMKTMLSLYEHHQMPPDFDVQQFVRDLVFDEQKEKKNHLFGALIPLEDEITHHNLVNSPGLFRVESLSHTLIDAADATSIIHHPIQLRIKPQHECAMEVLKGEKFPLKRLRMVLFTTTTSEKKEDSLVIGNLYDPSVTIASSSSSTSPLIYEFSSDDAVTIHVLRWWHDGFREAMRLYSTPIINRDSRVNELFGHVPSPKIRLGGRGQIYAFPFRHNNGVEEVILADLSGKLHCHHRHEKRNLERWLQHEREDEKQNLCPKCEKNEISSHSSRHLT